MIEASGPLGEALERRIPRGLGVFNAVYDSALERIKTRVTWTGQRVTIRRALVLIVSCATLIAAIVITADVQMAPYALLISAQAKLSLNAAEIAVAMIALALCVAPALGLFAGARQLATALASRAIREMDHAEAPPPGARALIEMMQAAILVVVTVIVLAIVQPFLETQDGVAVLAVAAATICVVIWRSAKHTVGQVREAAQLLAAALASRGAQPVDHSRLGELALPELGGLSAVRIAAGSPAVGKTVGELDLRCATGAMVVAIEREPAGVIIPGAGEVLRDGDVLGLAGADSAIRAAMAMLSPASPPAAAQPAS